MMIYAVSFADAVKPGENGFDYGCHHHLENMVMLSHFRIWCNNKQQTTNNKQNKVCNMMNIPKNGE